MEQAVLEAPASTAWSVVSPPGGGAIFRFAEVGSQPLWLDEATDASFAARSFWSCVFAEYVHPPLYRALLHYVVQGFGDSAVAVRFLPAVFGICAIPAVAILACQLLPEAELSATALVATSPFLIYFSQENRNYSLFILLTLLSTWALFRFKESGRYLAPYPSHCRSSFCTLITLPSSFCWPMKSCTGGICASGFAAGYSHASY